jgi:hypothetical protein
VFTINDIVSGKPIMYHVKDQQNEIIKGAFYKQELQQVKHVSSVQSIVL